ncbi:Fic family protein [Streptomyces marokkonensis]|uniref:Fic family protein n=1 Tax=Streptomyces marokkonensis TaxID=324855 RepID=UPI0011F374CF|nr:Fic family protein [Streptomyces marokkonensis]
MTTAERDASADWCRARARVDWTRAGAAHLAEPVPPARDGFTAWCTGPVHRRDPVRARRLLAAYAAVRSDAVRRPRPPLTFSLLSGWQQQVLGSPGPPPFRTGDARTKAGRERRAPAPHTPAVFARCLAEADDPGVPLPARAARAYLDVAFFHPFEDGNARAALLTLAFVLARESVVLHKVRPLRSTRYADDPDGAADLAVLVAILIR